MDIIVAGCGRVGANLATRLANDGHNVSVIDRDPAAFARLGSGFNGITVKGIAFDQDVLRLAGIERCDVFAAVTDSDNANLMAAEVAEHIFGVDRTVARLYDPERESTYKQLGIEFVDSTALAVESLNEIVQSKHDRFVNPRLNILEKLISS